MRVAVVRALAALAVAVTITGGAVAASPSQASDDASASLVWTDDDSVNPTGFEDTGDFVGDPEDADLPITTQSADGYQIFGAACATVLGSRICWPGGLLGHTIRGDGRRITDEQGDIEDVTGLGIVGGIYCNWQFHFRYYDTAGKWYRTRSAPEHNSCTTATQSPIGARMKQNIKLQHYGKACAVFHANGKDIVRQCHNIS